MDNLKIALYLDDIRTPTETLPGYQPWIVVRTYQEFTEHILDHGMPDLISFDHDLADEHILDYSEQFMKMGWQSPRYDSYTEKTGMDCAKFICDVHADMKLADTPIEFPRCVVHSHNPVGCTNIISYINGYKKHVKLIPDCYEQRFPFTSDKPESI